MGRVPFPAVKTPKAACDPACAQAPPWLFLKAAWLRLWMMVSAHTVLLPLLPALGAVVVGARDLVEHAFLAGLGVPVIANSLALAPCRGTGGA